MKLKGLVVEDDVDGRDTMQMCLDFWDLTFATSFPEAKELLKNTTFDFVIIDLIIVAEKSKLVPLKQLPVIEGISFVDFVVEAYPKLPIIVHSALLPNLGTEVIVLQKQYPHLLYIAKPTDFLSDHFRSEFENFIAKF